MDTSDSFYEFDAIESTFTDSKRNCAQSNLFQNQDDTLKFGDLGLYNEESIDLEQYLHLGNTPPNGNGDELLKQFGAYSSSPPVTLSIKPNVANINNKQGSLFSNGLDRVTFSTASSDSAHTEPRVVQAAFTSSATTTQLGFQIKQEIEEHSVPEFEEPLPMPPGEEQAVLIAQGDQGNHLGGQQTYLFATLTPSNGEDVVTTSSAAEPYKPANSLTSVEAKDNNGANSAKKRQRAPLDKESDEYKNKRMRNNIAVRKSREKSKARNRDLQGKVQSLQSENEKLNKKVELLTKELTVLRSLFTTVKPSAGQ